MAESNNELVKKLEESVSLLLSRYHAAKRKVLDLEQEIVSLNEKLVVERGEKSDLEERFNNYRLSAAMMGSVEERAEAKRRINQIVREIDKCIALLNQ